MIVREKLYIGGSWADPSDTTLLDIRSPHDQSLVGRSVQAVQADVDRAVAAARMAFDEGPWRHARTSSCASTNCARRVQRRSRR